MKLELLPKLAQQQTLSPKLMVSMRMLPLTTTELELQIERELEENPALELAPQTAEVTAATLQSDVLAGRLRLFQPFQDRTGGRRPDAEEGEDYFAGVAAPAGGLAAHLQEQLRVLELAPGVRAAAEELIGNLDWRGYLVAPVEELRAQCPFHLREHFDAAFEVVRCLEPAGVGAEDLLDCLLLQCRRWRERHPLAERILREQFGPLLHNRLPQIAEATGATLAEVKAAVAHISRCAVHPGAEYASESARTIAPDVVIEEGSHGYRVRIVDEGVPRLQLSEQCRELLAREDLAPEVARYLRKKIESAQWLIQAIDGRRRTLQHIAETVLEFQQGFMAEGPGSLRPLNMRTVAAAVGVHISTVSRAIKGKYIQTPWGMFPLRSFFEGGVERDEGEPASKRSLKERIAAMIAREDKQEPLSDGDIAAKLRAQGFNISRRTVSKYRAGARIPPAPMRREFAA